MIQLPSAYLPCYPTAGELSMSPSHWVSTDPARNQGPVGRRVGSGRFRIRFGWRKPCRGVPVGTQRYISEHTLNAQ